MSQVQKILIGVGVFLVIVGWLWPFLTSSLKLGKLPGDIAIEKENFKFYFPVTTSILVSVILTVVMALINWLTKKIKT
jgi:hypothetical protein